MDIFTLATSTRPGNEQDDDNDDDDDNDEQEDNDENGDEGNEREDNDDGDDEGNEQEDNENNDSQVELKPVVKRSAKPCPHTGQSLLLSKISVQLSRKKWFFEKTVEYCNAFVTAQYRSTDFLL